MKSLTGSLIATLLGAAMLVVGIVGVAGVFDGDESDADEGSSAPVVTDISSCGSSDSRFAGFNSYEAITPSGRGTLVVTCRNGTLSGTFASTDLATKKARTLALWLYRNRNNASTVAVAPQEPGDPDVLLDGNLRSNSADYTHWVVSAEPEGENSPARPTDILLKGEL